MPVNSELAGQAAGSLHTKPCELRGGEEGGWGLLAGLHEVFVAALCLINPSSQHRDALCQRSSICKMGVERSERDENGIIEKTGGGIGTWRRVRRLEFSLFT